MKPLFYVTLPDDFKEKCDQARGGLFLDLDDPYKEASQRLTIGKVYPVMEVSDDDSLVLVDDSGHLFKVNGRMVKYSDGTD
ncbi:MAG: hypothetical protein JXA95_07440 [Spirochaetales bacterium]|nr:hypothetical protein [Spirochaetales bacterium]